MHVHKLRLEKRKEMGSEESGGARGFSATARRFLSRFQAEVVPALRRSRNAIEDALCVIYRRSLPQKSLELFLAQVFLYMREMHAGNYNIKIKVYSRVN